jgi:hypothetical protein
MASQMHIATWAKVEAYIQGAIDIMGDALPNQVRSEAEEYLTHNELGLAFECLLPDKDKWQVGEEAGTQLDKAAALMNRQLGMWRLKHDN